MKIDKKNPRHWYYLALFSINVLIGIAARWIIPSNKEMIVLYGHKLHGNLKALYDYILEKDTSLAGVTFLTMDRDYSHRLRAQGITVLSALSLRDMISVCRSTCIVTDHGTHVLYLLLKLTSIKFVDVWHGIPFKGFDANDFRILHAYDAVLVPSPSMKTLYEERFGFNTSQLLITGYGRTDRLVQQDYDRQAILQRLDIDNEFSNIVLMAPTWSHGKAGRTSVPFNIVPENFFGQLNTLAKQNNILLIFRIHLNSKELQSSEWSNIRFMPLALYPDTEELLFIADVLVSDWSSIAFDFLVQFRPTLFLDVEAPFNKGFSYGPEFRFGPIISDFDELLTMIKKSCSTPDVILANYREKMAAVADEIYGGYMDGNASARYFASICELCQFPTNRSGNYFSNSHLSGK